MLSEGFPRWNFVPRRGTRRMRQWNQFEAVAPTRDTEFATDDVFQLRTVDELHNCEAPNGNNKTRPQNSNLIIHPQRTISNLVRRGDAIGAAGIFTRKTTADSSEIE